MTTISTEASAVADLPPRAARPPPPPAAPKRPGAMQTGRNCGNLNRADRGRRRMTRLTRINEELFSQLHLTPPEAIRYKSFDGRTIEAWVQRPPDFNASKKYPLI